MNASAIAAHDGSVSAGTVLTAISFLDNTGIAHESCPVIMLAVMESLAIIIGLLLASWSRRRLGITRNDSDRERACKPRRFCTRPGPTATSC